MIQLAGIAYRIDDRASHQLAGPEADLRDKDHGGFGILQASSLHAQFPLSGDDSSDGPVSYSPLFVDHISRFVGEKQARAHSHAILLLVWRQRC